MNHYCDRIEFTGSIKLNLSGPGLADFENVFKRAPNGAYTVCQAATKGPVNPGGIAHDLLAAFTNTCEHCVYSLELRQCNSFSGDDQAKCLLISESLAAAKINVDTAIVCLSPQGMCTCHTFPCLSKGRESSSLIDFLDLTRTRS